MNAAQLQSSGRCPTSTRCLAAPSWLPKRPWQQSVLTKAARQLELNRSAARGHLLSPCAFQIDRRHHMELQWQRHQEQEQLLAAVPASLAGGGIIEVASLAHLEALLGAAGGQLVVLTAYTRSCGICKHVLRELEVVLCEARQQRARIVFMRHDLQDAWDFPTDVARWYKLKTAPRFLFFVDGALLRTASIADSRTSAGSRSQVTAMLHHEHRKLRDTLRELLALHTPSARR